MGGINKIKNENECHNKLGGIGMININKDKEWDQYKKFMKNEFERIGEYVRITRREKK